MELDERPLTRHTLGSETGGRLEGETKGKGHPRFFTDRSGVTGRDGGENAWERLCMREPVRFGFELEDLPARADVARRTSPRSDESYP